VSEERKTRQKMTWDAVTHLSRVSLGHLPSRPHMAAAELAALAIGCQVTLQTTVEEVTKRERERHWVRDRLRFSSSLPPLSRRASTLPLSL